MFQIEIVEFAMSEQTFSSSQYDALKRSTSSSSGSLLAVYKKFVIVKNKNFLLFLRQF